MCVGLFYNSYIVCLAWLCGFWFGGGVAKGYMSYTFVIALNAPFLEQLLSAGR